MKSSGRNTSRSGGSILAFSIIAGAVAGTIGGQPSIGFIAGTAAGLLMLGLIYLWDRRRER